jgi:glycerophosphoryl diester phosphodiesterase
MIIAHRGAAGDAPENTMAAFALARRQGADAIEFDVRLSRDGVPVVIHDARIDRTTNARGRVRELSARELRRLDAGSWFNRRFPGKSRARFAGQKIPLLRDLLEWMCRQDLPGFLEIKEGGRTQPGIEEKILEDIRRTRTESLVTIISFDFRALERIRALHATIAIGVSVERPTLARRQAEHLAARYLVPHWALATKGFLRRAHASRLGVVVWTVNQPRRMKRKTHDGVDGIITDYPARLHEIRAALTSGRGLDLRRGRGEVME